MRSPQVASTTAGAVPRLGPAQRCWQPSGPEYGSEPRARAGQAQLAASVGVLLRQATRPSRVSPLSKTAWFSEELVFF